MFRCPNVGCQWEGNFSGRKVHLSRWCGKGLKTTVISPPPIKKIKIGESATGAPEGDGSAGNSSSSSDSASSSGSDSNDDGDHGPADWGGQSDDGNRYCNRICITYFNSLFAECGEGAPKEIPNLDVGPGCIPNMSINQVQLALVALELKLADRQADAVNRFSER
jgi:hypothetical protein